MHVKSLAQSLAQSNAVNSQHHFCHCSCDGQLFLSLKRLAVQRGDEEVNECGRSDIEFLPYPMRDAERLLSLGECRSYFFLKHQRSFGTEFSSFYSVCLTHFIFFSFFYFYYYYFGPAMRHVESSFLGQGLNSHYLHWKHRVPTTGPLGKSQTLIFRAVLGSQKN